MTLIPSPPSPSIRSRLSADFPLDKDDGEDPINIESPGKQSMDGISPLNKRSSYSLGKRNQLPPLLQQHGDEIEQCAGGKTHLRPDCEVGFSVSECLGNCTAGEADVRPEFRVWISVSACLNTRQTCETWLSALLCL